MTQERLGRPQINSIPDFFFFSTTPQCSHLNPIQCLLYGMNNSLSNLTHVLVAKCKENHAARIYNHWETLPERVEAVTVVFR